MLRKILWISLALALIPSLSSSQTQLSLMGGIGFLHYDRRPEADRYRLVVAFGAANTLRRDQDVSIDLKGEAEVSYRWYSYENVEDVSSWGIKGLLDVFPEVRLNPNGGAQPCVGAGVTFGLDKTIHTVKNVAMWDASGDYMGTVTAKTGYRDFIYGFNAQPSLKFQIEKFSVRGAIKYRFFFDKQHYEFKWNGQKEFSENIEYQGQSMDIILSAGINLGAYVLEGGLQAENWVFKHEDRDGWPEWPQDWEYLLFAKINFSR